MPANTSNFDSILAGIQSFGQRNGAVTDPTQGTRANILPGPAGGGKPPAVGDGSSGAGGGGLTVYMPPGTDPTGSGGSGSSGATSSTVGALGQIGSLIACFVSPTTCLLRLVMLILGIICVIGAIYLYKPTQEIVAAPARAIRQTATESAAAMAA